MSWHSVQRSQNNALNGLKRFKWVFPHFQEEKQKSLRQRIYKFRIMSMWLSSFQTLIIHQTSKIDKVFRTKNLIPLILFNLKSTEIRRGSKNSPNYEIKKLMPNTIWNIFNGFLRRNCIQREAGNMRNTWNAWNESLFSYNHIMNCLNFYLWVIIIHQSSVQFKKLARITLFLIKSQQFLNLVS